MIRIIKNHFVFALALFASIIATTLSIIGMERTIGLHEMFGRAGGVELFVGVFIFTGLSTFLTTQYLNKSGSRQRKLIKQHLGSVGLFYLPIVFIPILNYSKDGTSGLRETYFFILLFSLIVLVTINFITLMYKEQKTSN